MAQPIASVSSSAICRRKSNRRSTSYSNACTCDSRNPLKFRKDSNERQEKKQEAQEVAETAAVAAAEASWPQTRAILRVIIIVLLVAALIWVLYKLEGVLLLVVLSVFFAYLIAPLVEFVRRPFNLRGREHIMPRTAALGIVYFVLFGSLILAL